jgi:hypothetical protein
MVISIGSDIGFSETGTGGTARGIACGLAGGWAARTSALCSTGGGTGLAAGAAGLAIGIGLGLCVAAGGVPVAGEAVPGAAAGPVPCSTGACENSARASEAGRVAGDLRREVAAAGSSVVAVDGVVEVDDSVALPAIFSASSFRNQQRRPLPRSMR